jgi:uncharacterized membrane protein
MSATVRAGSSNDHPWAGYLLGFALGGFFDGILLHQILQWHHLLLAIQSGPFRDMRTQILADGLFHLLMYAIALGGIFSLWRSRQTSAITGKQLFAHALIGFGLWHILDALLSHWLLGIHRIKMDSSNPLAWDLLWFVVFGVLPLVAGILIQRGNSADSTRALPIASLLVVAAVTGGILGAVPPASNAQQVAVLVRPSQAARLLSALPEIDAGIVWADRSGALWVFSLADGARAAALYDFGALYVTRSPAALGCLAWSTFADDV